MGELVIPKAERLRSEGKVRVLSNARSYQVDGDHASYLVTITNPDTLAVRDNFPGPPAAWCSCPATGACSHLAAALVSRVAEINEHGTVEVPA